MNYFGHAVIAHWAHPEPTFVLGAMLPDLAALTDESLEELDDPKLVQGVRFHHQTDALFHSSPTFVGLCREALSAARSVGVRKGPARGMTHLVVELVIDAHLAEQPGARAAYLDAMAARPEVLRKRPRLVEGLDWLLARGAAVHNATPERLRAVLEHALRGRPRLEPAGEELDAALDAWVDLPARVEAGLETLLSDLAPLYAGTSPGGAARFGALFLGPPGEGPVTSAP